MLSAPSKPRPPIASVSVAMSIGFREFTYENNTTRDKLRDESESGQVILGPLVELWPGTLFGIRVLRGLSVMGRFQFRINEQPVTGGGIMNNLSTFWQSFEVSLKHKWLFAEKYGVEVGAGWTREQYRFNGTPTDKLLVPEATVEHTSVKDLIAQLEGVQPDGEMYDAKVKVLSEYVKHHVKEEQTEMFPKAKA